MSPLILAAVIATNTFNQIENPARITSDTTYYDRKEGLVVFRGHVHVDDSEYQMHADRAFVYISPTNTLESIAALGSVALTNGTKRAYGEKVTYHQANGLVVMHGSEANPAVVTDASESGDRTVRGRKIRFWINREQVEVEGAEMTAPRKGVERVGVPGMKL